MMCHYDLVSTQLAVREHEFARCDYDGSGALSPHEFAMHLLSFAPADRLDAFAVRADNLKDADKRFPPIGKSDFFTFSELLLHLGELQVWASSCVIIA